MSLVIVSALVSMTGVILDRGLAPFLSVADASPSFVVLVVSSLMLINRRDEGFRVALLSGLLLDLLAPSPFGVATVTLLALWVGLGLAARFRLLVPQPAFITLTMMVVGLATALPDAIRGGSWLVPLANALLSAVVGTILFPAIRWLYRGEEAIRV
jgi:cell shape-determining protein MreD